ncbi:MAG: cation transporter [Sphaerochaeta sp.]
MIAIGALKAILQGGYLIEASLALMVSFISMIVCIAVLQVLARFSKKLNSPDLKAESRSWLIDSALSLASALAVLVMGFAQGKGYTTWPLQYPAIPPEIMQENLKKVVHDHGKKWI